MCWLWKNCGWRIIFSLVPILTSGTAYLPLEPLQFYGNTWYWSKLLQPYFQPQILVVLILLYIHFAYNIYNTIIEVQKSKFDITYIFETIINLLNNINHPFNLYLIEPKSILCWCSIWKLKFQAYYSSRSAISGQIYTCKLVAGGGGGWRQSVNLWPTATCILRPEIMK